VRREQHPGAGGPRLGKQVELRAARVGDDDATGAAGLQPFAGEPDDLGVRQSGHAWKRDQLLQQLARDRLDQ
jgi:hypothetical protein